MTLPITEEWLIANGFKWHQIERQPDKHCLLWLGPAIEGNTTGFQDLGIELASNRSDWFCWLRADYGGRYSRFLHVRHIKTTAEVVTLIEALTGAPFDPSNTFYGALHTPTRAERIREEHKRLDVRLIESGCSWSDRESDTTIGRPLIDHLDAHEKAKTQ